MVSQITITLKKSRKKGRRKSDKATRIMKKDAGGMKAGHCVRGG